MNLSTAAQLIISLCWHNSEPRATNFIIGDTYENEGKKFKATEELYDEIVSYQQTTDKPFKLNRMGKVVNLIGGK